MNIKHTCPLCNAEICQTKPYKHLRYAHYDIYNSPLYYSIGESILTGYDRNILFKIFNVYWNINKNIPISIVKTIVRYLKLYSKVKAILDITNDEIDYIIYEYIPWKSTHKNISSGHEFCNKIFPFDETLAIALYNEVVKNNPYYGHGSELSPFSKDFIGYKDLTDEEKSKKILSALGADKDDRTTTQLKYWINKKGYTEEEAKLKIKNRQTTFSKDKCIEKYGMDVGIKIFEERQVKWQTTLKSKPLDEINSINSRKIFRKGPKSTLEFEFLKSIYNDKSCYNKTIIINDNTHAIVDLCVKNKIIEFYGDYWHCNPKIYKDEYWHAYKKQFAKDIQLADNIRINQLKQLGYCVKIVWESDYKNNPDAIIKECKDFIYD